jgi:hypothetical protein
MECELFVIFVVLMIIDKECERDDCKIACGSDILAIMSGTFPREKDGAPMFSDNEKRGNWRRCSACKKEWFVDKDKKHD